MDFINKHRRKLLVFFIVLLIVSAGITGSRIYYPAFLDRALGFIVVPVQSAVHGVSQNIGQAFAKRQDAETLRTENEELKRLVAELTDENKRLSQFEEENIELSKLLDINRKYPDYEKMGVQIISADTSNWYNVFTIDRGSADGVETDMFVVAEGGLVGRVFEVSEKYSKLMALIDDRSAVHGQSRQTEDVGVVRGDTYLMQSGLCVMEYIDLDAKMSVGDEIITSLYSEYPAGITIGYVNEVYPSADGLTRTAIVAPSVDFRTLTKAMVLMRQKED